MHPPLPRLSHVLVAALLAIPAIARAEPTPPPPPDFGQIKGESQEDKHKDWIQASPTTCPVRVTDGAKVASDPEEGGQVAKAGDKASAEDWRTHIHPNPIGNLASDPEEGGQIARTAKPKPKPKPDISDINVMKTSDKASAKVAEAAPSGDCH